jgi:hypothetical protein
MTNFEEFEPSPADLVHATMKAALDLLPGGGSVVELLELAFAPPLARRRDAWLTRLYIDLKMLTARVKSISFDTLADNEQFVSAVLEALHIALRTHQEEKLEALGNAVLNTLLEVNPSEDERLIMFRYVGDLTPSHIRMLQRFKALLDDSAGPTDFYDIIAERMATDGFQSGTDLFNVFWNDLSNMGLLNLPVGHAEEIQELLTETEVPQWFGISDLGERFLHFIGRPAILQSSDTDPN